MVFLPFDPDAEVSKHRRRLPHWEQPGRTYFITFRLGDSIPAAKLDEWTAERDSWRRVNPQPWTAEQWQHYQTRFLDRIERWADSGYGACVLRDPAIREILAGALHHFDENRYHLDCFVIMPNHVHILVSPVEPNPLSRILHSWKSFTSSQINKHLGQKGALWMDENFDHIVRSSEQLEKYRAYIRSNPIEAGLDPLEYELWSRDGNGNQ